jgi:hypothetical protein
MKSLICTLVFLAAVSLLRAQQIPARAPDSIVVDASAPVAAPETGYLHLGGTSANRHSLQVNSRSLVLDNKPWLPVMGEFHFSRYPESQWEHEILKMQAAGVNILSTYVFWIQHEEIEGNFDWTGQRDLRHFVELCARHGMYVWLRIGPWAHGEVRNGGFPDWVTRLPNTRTNDPLYLHFVERFFNQIGLQVRGLTFKDGGPVIGTQLENEYGLHGPGRGAQHILKLKQLALAAGIDTPLYSVTGWPSLDFPPQEVIPVSGGYPDGFWYGSQTDLPPSMTYLFNFNRELGDMGATVASEDPTGKVDLKHDPYFAAEEAGGMASAYHRRPVLSADDIAALTLTNLGSGINLYGYYMFHGGANPRGKLTTLQESTATGYPNDLPELTYDFNAPLGEFGQERESYRKTRLLHLFLNAFGSQLATMPAFAPAKRTRDAADTVTPRVAVRTDGRSGFVFVNNHVRQLAMPDRPGFQVRIKLPGGEMLLPEQPVTVPADRYFAWPFNLRLGAGILRYSTAQLFTQVDTPSGKLVVFFAIPGIEPEFSFESASLKELSAPAASVSHAGPSTLVSKLHPGENSTIQLTDRSGARVTLLLFSQPEAEDTAVLHIGSSDYLARTTSSVFFDGRQLHLESAQSPTQQVALLPNLPLREAPAIADGLWTRHTFTQPEKHPELTLRQFQTATPRVAMTMGPYVDWRKTAVPVVPPDGAFANAAQWLLQWTNPDMSGLSEALLQIDYSGDIARLESQGILLDDNFFHGQPWQIGLQRFAAETWKSPMTLEILPMPTIAPIYLDQRARQQIKASPANPAVTQARIIPVYQSIATPESIPAPHP